MKMFGTVFFAATCFFFIFVIIADGPLERINRGCTPVTWVGKAFVTMASIVSTGAETKAKVASHEFFQTCRYTLYRQFYAEKHAAMKAEQEAREKAASEVKK